MACNRTENVEKFIEANNMQLILGQHRSELHGSATEQVPAGPSWEGLPPPPQAPSMLSGLGPL